MYASQFHSSLCSLLNCSRCASTLLFAIKSEGTTGLEVDRHLNLEIRRCDDIIIIIMNNTRPLCLQAAKSSSFSSSSSSSSECVRQDSGGPLDRKSVDREPVAANERVWCGDCEGGRHRQRACHARLKAAGCKAHLMTSSCTVYPRCCSASFREKGVTFMF